MRSSHTSKLIARIKGGLGNQLFCYAAARRLALVNNAELVIDDVTGFVRDRQYRRQYALDRFHITARRATAAERLEPLERYRRGLAKFVARNRPFYLCRYVEQEGFDFDRRLLDFKINGTVYIDGYWQSENYFKDVEQTIREDLRIIPPEDTLNQDMAKSLSQCNAVAVHVRWFDPPGNETTQRNMSANYYHRAVAEIEQKVSNPHFFLFSDDSAAAKRLLNIPEERITCMDHNRGDENACADLWLMTQCKHFIIANSSFSWWGAWLGGDREKVIITPDLEINGKTARGVKGLIPNAWVRI